MHIYRLVIMLCVTCVFAGCMPLRSNTKTQTTSAPSLERTQGASSAVSLPSSIVSSIEIDTQKLPKMSADTEGMKQGMYVAYHDGVLGAERAVLFFHAAWCPKCRDADTALQALYNQDAPAISTYKIDYDTATELKQRFGVVTQHTFVLVDIDGTVLESRIGPSHEAILSLLR